MLKVLKSLVQSSAVAILMLLAGFSTADEAYPFQDQIEARKAFMQVSKFNLRVLSGMVKGKYEYTPELAAAVAGNLHKSALMNNHFMWPTGSDASNPELAGKTEALKKGWDEFEQLMKKHQAWVDATATLAEQAGLGKKQLKQSLGAVGRSCKGCHDDYKKQD